MSLPSPIQTRSQTAGRLQTLLAVCLMAAALNPVLFAQPVFEGVETASAAVPPTGVGITVNVPAGSAGDLLIAVWGIAINPLTGTPAGWTAIPGLAGFNGATCTGIDCQINVFYRISDGTETSVTFGFTGSPGGPRSQVGAVLRYSGTHATDPIGPVAEQSGSGGSPVAPAIVTTEDDTRVLRLALSSGLALLTNPPADQRFNIGSGMGGDVAVVMAGSDALQAVAGNTGTASWSDGENWVAATVAIRPEAAIVDADLSISKNDGEIKVNPGDTITYTIVVSNDAAGNDVMGAAVDDIFPSDLTCTWTCMASAGSGCTAGPVNGDIADTVDLLAGGTATYSAECDIDGSASGSISNTATVTAPMGVNDTDGGNNDAQDVTQLNIAPMAVCADVTVDVDPLPDTSCSASAASIDGGTFDPDGDMITIVESPSPPYSLGDTMVTLSVTDALGLSDECSATVTVEDNTDPLITAPDDILNLECTSPMGTPADLGMPTVADSCPTMTSNDAPALFPLGNTAVTWTATDSSGNSASDTQLVQVVDTTEPVIACNSPATITPPDAPISFSATATDVCAGDVTAQITAYGCASINGAGKVIDKTESCIVSFQGDTVTIDDVGGVGTTIFWDVTASDGNGNTATTTCQVQVAHP
ncbi:MAG TPA: hypothetical protein VLU25_09370 [Acidobacteriota bacterium]|nr:hypothetical protein [Acidobacteriota bacterium]